MKTSSSMNPQLSQITDNPRRIDPLLVYLSTRQDTNDYTAQVMKNSCLRREKGIIIHGQTFFRPHLHWVVSSSQAKVLQPRQSTVSMKATKLGHLSASPYQKRTIQPSQQGSSESVDLLSLTDPSGSPSIDKGF